LVWIGSYSQSYVSRYFQSVGFAFMMGGKELFIFIGSLLCLLTWDKYF